jgi:hypothetical protein
MATSTAAPIINPLTSLTISEKLTKTNHALWKMHILAVIRGAGLEGFLTRRSPAPATNIKSKDADEDVPNPVYQAWAITDQHVLGFLLSSMTKETLSQVRGCRTAAETWIVVEGNFTSATRARTVNTRIALATTKKGDLSIADYINKMHNLGDEMATVGKLIDDDDDLISYILTGLDYDYNLVITTLIVKDNLTLVEVYSQLLSFKQRIVLQQTAEHYASVATCGRGGGMRSHGPTRGGRNPRGRGGRNGGRRGRSSPPQPDNIPLCQLCGKRGHTVMECWHHFDENYVPNEKYAGVASNSSYGVDYNWYTDTRVRSRYGRA